MTKPWLASTGPQSKEGKRVSSSNAWKGGRREAIRANNRAINARLRAFDEQLKTFYAVSRALAGVRNG